MKTDQNSSRIRNIVCSYVMDGYSEGAAVNLAAQLVRKLDKRAQRLRQKRLNNIAPRLALQERQP